VRVAVTGGCGFIGSHLVDKLVSAGHEVVVIDSCITRNVRSAFEYHEVDLTDSNLEDLRLALKDVEVVYHLAAMADVNQVAQWPQDAVYLNVFATANLLEACKQMKVRRFIYASTIWVYSDCPGEYITEETPIVPPTHLYTATKYAGELLVQSYTKMHGMEHVILRYGIPYGPRCRPNAVVPAFILKVYNVLPIQIQGDGSVTRPFVYVEDLAWGNVFALYCIANRTYNLSSDVEISVKQVAEMVVRLMGKGEVEYKPARAGDFAGRKEISPTRAAHEMGWWAATSFEEGVHKTLTWMIREFLTSQATP